ncbi:hypothetical protein AGDE_03424 [Angomonas deanei]|nr:hypothetical protein AGDE_03424 [Angomonas deanei]|eukprot:EPY40504.1 hypothetical protein AGDE_03424 [Angomonas deanei]
MYALMAVSEKTAELEKADLVINEDDILSLFEDICNPFMEKGEWIRRAELTLDEKKRTVSFNIGNNYTKCKRFCGTFSNVCEQVYDSDEATNLAADMLKLIKKRVGLVKTNEAEEIVNKVCKKEFCEHKERNMAALHQMLAKDDNLWGTLVEDKSEPADHDRIEVENLIAKMERDGKRSNVYSRDHVKKLQAAVKQGDRRAATKLDPTIRSLSDEEFEEVVRMAREEYNTDTLEEDL